MQITNLVELIWNDEWTSLLRICGAEESVIGENASDYDRFLSLCRSAHLLRGNRLFHRLSCFLNAILKSPVLLSEETAEKIWCETAAYFLFANDSRVFWETFEASPMESFSVDWCPRLAVSDFWDGDPLWNTAAPSWETWSSELKKHCDRAFEKAALGVTLTLPKDFAFSSPHPYSVGCALRQKERSQKDQSLLLSQLFRVLAEECMTRGKALWCRVECDPVEAVKLFDYAEDRVGLPRLIWSAEAAQPIAALLSFGGRFHTNPVEAALSSREALGEPLQAFSECYPLGKLWIFS